MGSSIFSIEVAARLDPAPDLLHMLRARSRISPRRSGYQRNGCYKARATLLAHLGTLERGCWDYFDTDDKAEGLQDVARRHDHRGGRAAPAVR